MKFIGILLCLLLLSGCATSKLDLSELSWQQIQKTHSIQKAKALEEHKVPITHKTPLVEIVFEHGQAQIPLFKVRSDFKPAKMIVYKGHCQTVALNQVNGYLHVDVEACYRGNEVLVDGVKYDYAKRYGTIRLAELPMWERGFTYKGISTTGYAKLSDTDISIKKLKTIE